MEEAEKIRAADRIRLHCVPLPITQISGPSSLGLSALVEVHSHGLSEYMQDELAVTVPAIFTTSAARLINSLADAVLNTDERFAAGDTCNWAEWGEFRLEAHRGCGGSRCLRIVPLPLAGTCEGCGKPVSGGITEEARRLGQSAMRSIARRMELRRRVNRP